MKEAAMRLHPRRAAAIATAAALFLAVAAQASTPAPVRTTRANEMLPAAGYGGRAGSEFLTWSRSRAGARSTYDAYLQRNGGPLVKLNKRGVGYAGDVDVSEHLVVYQQVRNHDSRIMFYDWKAKTRYAAPEEVNTPEWEFAPRIQGDHLLFGRETWRNGSERYELLLFNRADGTVTSLDTIPHGYDYGVVDPGQMTGDWVVWRKAVDSWAEQRVYRHNIVTGVTDEVPAVAGRYDFGASVTADGTVYFVRSTGGCQSVRIRSFTGAEGTSTALVYALRPGHEISNLYAEGRPDGSTHLLFDRLACNASTANWNIYRLLVGDVVPSPALATGHGAATGPPIGFAPWATHQLHG
jgi:hypothetical protein